MRLRKKLWSGDVMVMVETSVRSGFMEAPHTPDEGGSPRGHGPAGLVLSHGWRLEPTRPGSTGHGVKPAERQRWETDRPSPLQ